MFSVMILHLGKQHAILCHWPSHRPLLALLSQPAGRPFPRSTLGLGYTKPFPTGRPRDSRCPASRDPKLNYEKVCGPFPSLSSLGGKEKRKGGKKEKGGVFGGVLMGFVLFWRFKGMGLSDARANHTAVASVGQRSDGRFGTARWRTLLPRTGRSVYAERG